MTITGIDVSDHQSSTYDLDDHDFVVVKATEGTSYINPKHADQVERARSHDRVVGHYHYLVDSSGITAQMDYFLEHADPQGDEFLAVDWEDTGVSSSDKDTALEHLKNNAGGRKVLLYCNVDFWLNRDTSSKAGDGLWIAHYNGDPGNPGIEADWVIHQYTSDPIDTNVADFGSRADMAAWAAGEGADEEPRRALYDTADYTRTIPPGAWTTVGFNRQFKDGDWVDKDVQTSFLFGPCYYTASVGVRVSGLTRGQDFLMRLANYEETDEDGTYERSLGMPTYSQAHDSGDGRFVHTWNGFVPGAGNGRLRAEVRHEGEDDVTIVAARAEALYWPA